MITSSLKGIKLKKDETLKAFYDDFFEALSKFSAKVTDEAEKVEIIHKLILWPGSLSIEKYTTHRVVHQMISHLGEIGVQKLFETYKQIFLNKSAKNPENEEESWLNIERQNAGFMLHTLICHKQVQMSFDWRAEQLKFMLTLGLFYTNESGEIVTQKEDCGLIKNDFSEQLKNTFYSSLQTKLPRLEDGKKVLLSLVEICNEVLQRKHYNKYLRNRIDEKILKAWNDMYAEVLTKKKGTSENSLRLVFHILLLHMGLQLFREPEMAEIAILDLEKCMEKTKEKSRKAKINGEGTATEEPEWIEVVVDLFLHLLSQNNSALRSIVNTVFPHLCNNISLTAMHQILSVLNMKDGNNPLSESNEDQEELQEDKENEKDGKSDKSDISDDSSDENEEEDVENDEDDEEEEEDEEEIIEEEEEEGTFTDKLRNAVSTALGTVGKDADQESIDLDDMDEEEGRKLDEALMQAFKLAKQPEQNKRSKAYRVKTTTIMHFRIRVLDLIEIYIQHSPSLIMSLEIMLSLYNMIEYCGESGLKPLCNKLEKVLSKLTALRHFSNTEDVTEQNICDFLRMIVEKKVKAPVFEVFNKLRAKCTIFLITCGKIVGNSKSEREISSKILSILIEYLNDFIKLRNPAINITLLNDIFKIRWQGIWNLAVILSTNGLCDTTRVFRRIQIIELLNSLYKRNEIIRQDLQSAQKHLKSIERSFQKHIKTLVNKDQISVREFTAILDVLFVANRCYSKIPIKSHLDKETICECIQSIRQKVKLDNIHSYTRFCKVFGLTVMKNSTAVKPSIIVLENGRCETSSVDETEKEEDSVSKIVTKAKNKEREMSSQTVPETTKGKRKNKVITDFRKVKKLKKEKRLKVSSEGLNGGLSFANTSVDVEMLDDVNNSSSIGSE